MSIRSAKQTPVGRHLTNQTLVGSGEADRWGVMPDSTTTVNVSVMAQFDVDAMIQRYQDRAKAVRDRPLPPVAGEERQKFIKQAETDYTDFALVGHASWQVEDNELVLRIPLGSSE
jgi:hypothetical protein